MSGGADNTERFEQIGQSWIKHTFGADEDDDATLAATQVIALSSHSYVRAALIRISPTRTDGTTAWFARLGQSFYRGFRLIRSQSHRPRT